MVQNQPKKCPNGSGITRFPGLVCKASWRLPKPLLFPTLGPGTTALFAGGGVMEVETISPPHCVHLLLLFA